jgi:hypothetical protein
VVRLWLTNTANIRVCCYPDADEASRGDSGRVEHEELIGQSCWRTRSVAADRRRGTRQCEDIICVMPIRGISPPWISIRAHICVLTRRLVDPPAGDLIPPADDDLPDPKLGIGQARGAVVIDLPVRSQGSGLPL